MSILDSIGAAITKIIHGKSEDKLAVDKGSILMMIDNALSGLSQVTVDKTSAYITAYIKKNPNAAKNAAFRKAYSAYLNTINLHMETSGYFSTISMLAEKFHNDLELIRDNFTVVFSSGTGTSEIELDQLRTTHAAIIGYVDNVQRMTNWYCYMISLVELPGDIENPPKYRENFVVENAEHVGILVKYMLSRMHSNRSILDEIKDIKSDGNDVFLITNGTTLNNYADIHDFDQPSQNFLSAFDHFISGFLFVSQTFSNISRMFYDHNKAMREWMVTRTTMLQMSLNNVSPDSPEYERQETILKNYSNLIASYAKKIAEYEGNA